MERAEQEVKESRIIIDDLKGQITNYEEALTKAEKLDASNQQYIEFLKAEIVKVREALADKQTALDAKQKEVDAYKAALAKEVKKKNFFKKIAKFSSATAVIAIAVAVFSLKQ